jgi:hypothetical protein
MTRKTTTAILALALGLGAPAFAQEGGAAVDPAQIEGQGAGVAETLSQYGYDIDPSILTDDQRQRFDGLAVAGTGDNDGEDDMRRRIDEILVMDAGTATYVSEEMRSMMDNPTELQANAEALLNEYGMSDVDVSGLTTEQLAQLWFLQESGDDSSDGDVRMRIEEILGQS